jgi:hypothetical protein
VAGPPSPLQELEPIPAKVVIVLFCAIETFVANRIMKSEKKREFLIK